MNKISLRNRLIKQYRATHYLSIVQAMGVVKTKYPHLWS